MDVEVDTVQDVPVLEQKMQEIFDQYNEDYTEPFDKKNFAFSLKKDGNIIGGITGYSGFDWLYVSMLAIDADYRGNNYAITLMHKAEKEAENRGCKGIWLHTISFQAPEFYKKLGYEEFGRLDDCPKGHQRVYLRKYLNENH